MHHFAYRNGVLHAAAVNLASLAQAVGTRIGAGAEETRQIVLDFAGENLKPVPAADIKAKVSADKGTLRNIVVHPNPEIAGTRVSTSRMCGSQGQWSPNANENSLSVSGASRPEFPRLHPAHASLTRHRAS